MVGQVQKISCYCSRTNPLSLSDNQLGSTMSHNSKLKALKKADFAYFGATWYPQARYDRLKIVTLLAAWVGYSMLAG